jgi:hypothetical protein
MDRAARERSFSRRALIKAGWSVPVIVATVNLPTPAFAGSAPHGDAGHGDHSDNAGHSDSPHIDSGHADSPGLSHSDAPTVSGHADAPAVIGETPAPAAAPTAVPSGDTTVLPSELPPSSNGLAGTGIDARKLTEIGLGLLAAGAGGAGMGRERLAAEGFDDNEDFPD